jgi:hypothetical protein
MVEQGQLNAVQAAQLLDTLEIEPAQPLEPVRERMLRIRASMTNTPNKQTQFMVSMPVSFLKLSLRLSGYLLPQLKQHIAEDILQAIEQGKKGRILEINDLEQHEHLEVFVE